MRHSVIIPAFNAASYLQECVASVLSQLGADDEVVIIDDASTDQTGLIARAITDQRVYVLTQVVNQGISGARNRAMEYVTGDYVHFLDHDDLWPSHRMERIALLLSEHAPDLLSGWVEHFYCPSMTEVACRQFALPPRQPAALSGSVVISRKAMARVGLFDTELSSGEFLDFLSRAVSLGLNWHKTDHVLLLRRIHGRNHTLSDQTASASYLTVIRRHLARGKST